MTAELPVKSFILVNLVLTLVVTGIVFLFLYQDKNEIHKLLYTTITAIAIAVIAFSNVSILIFLTRKFGLNSTKFKIYRYILSYTASFATYSLLLPIFAYFSGISWSYSDGRFLFVFVVSSVLVCSFVLVLHRVILLLHLKAHADLELSKLKTAHAEAANLLLRQQIHPHFLFNALNTLKALYRKTLLKEIPTLFIWLISCGQEFVLFWA